MNTAAILRGWKSILTGRPPFLSIEVTKECPLSCPGCYAYGDEHIAEGVLLRAVSDFKGDELVRRALALIDEYQPLHVSIVGGEPLVRYRELLVLLPKICAQGIHVQLVTSAVRPIPKEWIGLEPMTIAVSIDGLAPEHDVRRKPATYERILKNIEGHNITVHCTVTRQMAERPGYLDEFMAFWSARHEVEKVWISLFTPQIGETSYEILPHDLRMRVIADLLELRKRYPKLAMREGLIKAFAEPPSDPEHCIFAQMTRTVTADLQTQVTPCQFGGNPDCSQCGCIASAGLGAIGRHELPGGIRVGTIYDASLRFGRLLSGRREQHKRAS